MRMRAQAFQAEQEGPDRSMDHRETLRRVAMNDEDFIERSLSMKLTDIDASGLDPKTHAMVRLGSLIALDAAPVSYQANTSIALTCGATVDEIVGALIAVAPIVGVAKVVSAAQHIALAVGYDIDADFEAVDPSGH